MGLPDMKKDQANPSHQNPSRKEMGFNSSVRLVSFSSDCFWLDLIYWRPTSTKKNQ
jgi:hypothetical protein